MLSTATLMKPSATASGGSIADLVRELLECVPHPGGVEALVLVGPEDRREQIRLQFAHHHVGVVTASGPPRR